MGTVKIRMADHDQARAWFLFPPTPTHIAEAEKEKLLLLSNTSNSATDLVVNYMGLLIAFIFVLVVLQMMMPSLRQVMDFFSAVYAPYGEDEYAEGRYDDYAYHDDYKSYVQQFRGVSKMIVRGVFRETVSV